MKNTHGKLKWFRYELPNTYGFHFYGENYDFWCVKMRTSFECVDLWDIVENGFEEPEQVTDLSTIQLKELKENRIKNANALSILHRAMILFFPKL